MRKKKNTNKIIEKVNEISSILDSNYFHTCINIKQKEIKWSIYYRNLPDKVYFSYKNKPLLTSDKNNISDIYRLKEKFETEKDKEYAEGLYEFVKVASSADMGLRKIQDLLGMLFMNTSMTLFICAIYNAIFMHNVIFSVLYLLATVIISFSYTKLSKKAREEIKKTNKKMKENYIKNKIRKKGLYFVERIKV